MAGVFNKNLYIMSGVMALYYMGSCMLPFTGIFLLAGIFLLLYLPALTAMLNSGHDYKNGFLLITFCCIIIYFLSELFKINVNIPLFLTLSGMGLLISELKLRNYSVEIIVGGSSLFATAICISVLFLPVFSEGGDLAVTFKGFFLDYINKALEASQNNGIEASQIELIKNAAPKLAEIAFYLIFSMVTVLSLNIAWLNFLIIKKIDEIRNHRNPSDSRLIYWKLPDFLVWVIIICGFLLFFSNTVLFFIALNIIIIMCTLYFMQGIAITAFWMDRKAISKPFKVAIYLLIAVQQIAYLLVTALGFFDIWGDFRKINKKNRV